MVEEFVLAISLAIQHAAAAPVPYHRRRSMEHGSDLGGSQQAGFSQTLLTALEPVAAQGMLDANGVKGAASARVHTPLVENGRDFIGSVAVQQPIDFLNDRGAQSTSAK